MTASNDGCTGEGHYTLATSAVGPVPALPASTLGAGYTPKIGLVGTKVNAKVPTVSLMVWANEPKPSTDETFKDLALGDELTFRGYTLKITSICPGNTQFDLLAQAEPTD
ncbi:MULTISPECIES: hypothetical protein [Arthrobacter]|uniref:hypothetical protein n=1 Tax=Arthrobacter TaxID=1663 RepID=UPI0028F735A7|nr:hypothetical protein [Arthrobacter sp. lap29]